MDCQWKEWQGWSACPRVCGVSIKSRHREMIENICGGRPCQGFASQKKTCDSWAEDIALMDQYRDENGKLNMRVEKMAQEMQQKEEQWKAERVRLEKLRAEIARKRAERQRLERQRAEAARRRAEDARRRAEAARRNQAKRKKWYKRVFG